MSLLINTHRDMQHSCKDTTLLPTFASNHDTARLAALVPSMALRRNALTYTMLADGIPTLYQGDEQSFSGIADPKNREAMWLSGFDSTAPLYIMIRTLNKLRTWVGRRDPSFWTSKSTIFWSGANNLAMRRGSGRSHIVAVLTNRESDIAAEPLRATNVQFTAGTALLDVFTCEEFIVGHEGVLSVKMTGGSPRVFYPLNALSGSSICQL
jgi:alpha-amylase